MPNIESDSSTLLVEMRLEVLIGRELSPEERSALTALGSASQDVLASFNWRRDQSIMDLAEALKRRRQLHKNDLLMRVLSLWMILQIANYLVVRSSCPNIMRLFPSGICLSSLYDLFMMAVLWRYNDQNIQKMANAYHRLSDIMDMQLGDAVEMLTQRYLFAMFACVFVFGELSTYYFSTNYALALDYLLFTLMVKQTVPALFDDLFQIVQADHYSVETSQFIEIPIEISRSFSGLWLMGCRIKTCFAVHHGDLSELMIFKPSSVCQVWRYAELGVNALGAVPCGVSDEYIKRSVLEIDGVREFSRGFLWLLAAVNTLDGRLFHTLVNAYHSDYYLEDIYCYRRKLNTVSVVFALIGA